MVVVWLLLLLLMVMLLLLRQLQLWLMVVVVLMMMVRMWRQQPQRVCALLRTPRLMLMLPHMRAPPRTHSRRVLSDRNTRTCN